MAALSVQHQEGPLQRAGITRPNGPPPCFKSLGKTTEADGFGSHPENPELIQWLNTWNTAQPPARRVHFYGIDLTGQGDHYAYRSVDATLTSVDHAIPSLGSRTLQVRAPCGLFAACSGPLDKLRLRVFTLFVLEDEGDRLVLRPFDADQHCAISGKGIAFESNRAGLRGCHLQDVVIPTGLGLEVFAVVNRGVVLAVGDVAVEEGLGGAFIHETARDDDDAFTIGDRHSAGLNDGLAGKIALGGHQRPGAVQGAVIAREGGEREEEGRQDGPGNCSS